jgi:hypothetical protein
MDGWTLELSFVQTEVHGEAESNGVTSEGGLDLEGTLEVSSRELLDLCFFSPSAALSGTSHHTSICWILWKKGILQSHIQFNIYF